MSIYFDTFDDLALKAAAAMLRRLAEDEERDEVLREEGFADRLPPPISPDFIRRVADRLDGIRSRSDEN